MFYRCIKVQHKPINIPVRDPNSKEQRNQVCCGLAHRTVRCTMFVRRWTSHSQVSLGALRYNSPDCPVRHRNARCASGATTTSRNGRLQKLKNRWTVRNSERQSQSAESVAHRTMNRRCLVWHRTVRCHKKTTAPTVDCSRTLTVGWHGGAPDSLHDLSGGAPDCPVRPSTAAIPNGLLVVEGYKYPQPPQLQASKFSEVPIQYKS
jgi:hypothetical protein